MSPGRAVVRRRRRSSGWKLLRARGFDFGVGALHSFLARDEGESHARQAIEAIGPVWDGNDGVAIVGGAAIFAAPTGFATWFSVCYLALMLVIVADRPRGVLRVAHQSWSRVAGGAPSKARCSRSARRWCRCCSASRSVTLLAGLPVDSSGGFTGDFVDLLTPYGVLVASPYWCCAWCTAPRSPGAEDQGGLRKARHAFARRSVWPAVIAHGRVRRVDRDHLDRRAWRIAARRPCPGRCRRRRPPAW